MMKVMKLYMKDLEEGMSFGEVMVKHSYMR